jgi:hypothetical protein
MQPCGRMPPWQASWQQRGKDTQSLVGIDPQFADVAGADFQLRPDSPALSKLGFREWDHTAVGPDCAGRAAGSVVC